jgi:hypothetical protein
VQQHETNRCAMPMADSLNALISPKQRFHNVSACTVSARRHFLNGVMLFDTLFSYYLIWGTVLGGYVAERTSFVWKEDVLRRFFFLLQCAATAPPMRKQHAQTGTINDSTVID